MTKRPWFEEWFDTEYYHLLYRNRDDKEAAAFIRLLVNHLNLPSEASVADIACGKGRHSRVLAGFGFKVSGFDLSENNIDFANKHAGGKEKFIVHDMRDPYPTGQFDAAFNLFTSFGYFDNYAEDLAAVKNIYDMLKPGGLFVQDYLNGWPVVGSLPENDHKKCGDCVFDIVKSWKKPYIVKNIQVQSKGEMHQFEEKVKVYTAVELRELHEQCGFRVRQVLGNYQLQPFEEGVSSRLIIISEKPV